MCFAPLSLPPSSSRSQQRRTWTYPANAFPYSRTSYSLGYPNKTHISALLGLKWQLKVFRCLSKEICSRLTKSLGGFFCNEETPPSTAFQSHVNYFLVPYWATMLHDSHIQIRPLCKNYISTVGITGTLHATHVIDEEKHGWQITCCSMAAFLLSVQAGCCQVSGVLLSLRESFKSVLDLKHGCLILFSFTPMWIWGHQAMATALTCYIIVCQAWHEVLFCHLI